MFENAFSLQTAIKHHLSRSTDPDDLLIICGDVLFTEKALRKVIERFEEKYRSTSFNAIGCAPGLQDEMTAVCYNEDGIITDYGDITGHKEIGVFVLYERYLQDAQQLLSENPNEWFPIIFKQFSPKRVLIPSESHYEISTPEYLQEIKERLPLKTGVDIRNDNW